MPGKIKQKGLRRVRRSESVPTQGRETVEAVGERFWCPINGNFKNFKVEVPECGGSEPGIIYKH